MDPVSGEFPLLYIVYFFQLASSNTILGICLGFLNNLKINNEQSKMLILIIFIVCYHHR